MKNRVIGCVSAMTMAGVMVFGGFQVPAMAATGDNDGVIQFQKVLEMQNAAGASVPDVTYTYTIVPGTGIGATATSPEVKPGVGTPTVSDVSYTNADTITAQEVEKTGSITFPEGTFNAPGIYRYVLTESANTNTDITDVDGNVRYVDVYVVNDDVNGGYKINASVFTEAAETPTFNDENKTQYGDKNDEITDAYQTYDLSLKKVVAGNMGDKSRKFDFMINFKGPANASFTFGDEIVTLNSSGIGSVNLALSHNEVSKEITGIPSTVTYTVTENLNSSEGYDTGFAVAKGTGASQTVTKDESASDATKVTAEKQTMTKADNAVTVTNTRVTPSPTGVMLSVTPYALLAGLASALGALFFRRKKLS